MTDYTLLEMFYSWEAKTPERVFLSQPHEGRYDHYTWHETGNQVRQVAYYLHSLQLPPNAKIGVFGYTTAHWVMAELAILMAGYIVVPIHYNIPPEDFKHIVLDS
ncbi:MAG: AMP-binding protein, partial [Cyclobacteriaceae bacterium]|nr:AMP-binding protein [Cyclobacteriaceae bacterium]